jgi:plastocyanin
LSRTLTLVNFGSIDFTSFLSRLIRSNFEIMKFAAASAFAAIAAVAPSFVSAANITVFVGASKDGTIGLRFDPQEITAAKGDIVNFEFRGGNHTVTQSSFANPCAWQFNTVTNQKGFNSGFLPFVNTSGQVSVYSLAVNDPSTPIWFFCGRVPHCKGGMYGAINAPATGDRSFANFAANVQTTEEPGLNVTVPFTPPTASTSAAAVPTSTTSNNNNNNTPLSSAPLSSAAALPTSSGAASPTPSGGAVGSVTAGSTFVVGLAALVAGLVL